MSKEILYLRGRSEEHPELLRLLHEQRFEVRSLRSVEDLLRRVKKSVPSAVIVDASSGDNEVSERLVELAEAKLLFALPLLFIGKRAGEQARTFLRSYRRLIAVNYPFRPESIFRQFHEAVLSAPANLLEEESGAPSASPGRDPANLKNSSGGAFFAKANHAKDFNDDLLLPPHANREAILQVLDALTKKNEWLGVHARRTAFVSSALVNKLNLGGALDNTVRAGSLMLNWGLAGESSRELTADLLVPDSTPMRRKIGEGFKLSADLIRKRVDDEHTAEVVESLAQLLLTPTASLAPEIRRAAECVLLAEAAGRACWKSARFDHMGANRLMRSMRRSPLLTDQTMIMAMSRALGEAAITSDGKSRIFTKFITTKERALKRRELDSAVNDAAKRFKNSATQKINLFELQPGMRLAEPLVAKDGQVILAADTIIDSDIMIRVMQLAAVRPIQNPIAVLRMP